MSRRLSNTEEILCIPCRTDMHYLCRGTVRIKDQHMHTGKVKTYTSICICEDPSHSEDAEPVDVETGDKL